MVYSVSVLRSLGLKTCASLTARPSDSRRTSLAGTRFLCQNSARAASTIRQYSLSLSTRYTKLPWSMVQQ